MKPTILRTSNRNGVDKPIISIQGNGRWLGVSKKAMDKYQIKAGDYAKLYAMGKTELGIELFTAKVQDSRKVIAHKASGGLQIQLGDKGYAKFKGKHTTRKDNNVIIVELKEKL